MERTDDSGRWVSDDGVSWSLVEPSDAWLAARSTPVDAPAPPTVEDLAAQVAELHAVIDELLGAP